jgi:hypothetical protein
MERTLFGVRGGPPGQEAEFKGILIISLLQLQYWKMMGMR